MRRIFCTCVFVCILNWKLKRGITGIRLSHTFMLIVAASRPRETCTAAHTSTAWNNKRNTWICIANHLCLLPVRRLTHSWGSRVYFYRLHLKSYSQATWIWFNGVSKTQQTNNVVLSYLCTVNEFCVSAEKTTQNQNTQKNDKKTPILLTGCFVRRFSVSMFSVFILTVQFNLGWKVKQKNKK